MAVIKVIEVLAQSDKSWEDAAQQALKEDGALTYRLDAKISFEVEGGRAKAGAGGQARA